MKRFPLNRGWLFSEHNDGFGFSFAKPVRRAVDLPHDFIVTKPRSADAMGGPSNGFFGEGQGVYDRELDIPEAWRGQRVLLDIDGAYMNAEVALNGELLALHPYGYTAFLVDLTPAIRWDGPNKLKIITQSRQPSTRWYCGGGLYRECALWVGGDVAIKPWDVFVTTPEVTADRATVDAKVTISNLGAARAVKLTAAVLDPDGKTVAEGAASVTLAGTGVADVSLSMAVASPKLWDLDAPNLYSIRLEVRDNDAVLDTFEMKFGIRTLQADAVNGFRLNGRPMKIKGGCIHHDNGILGGCAYPAADRRKIRILKDAGYEAVRISHYPPSLAMLEACDELGMLLMDEAFDVWRESKKPLDYHLYFEDWWERDIESMVLRDRNHPCVITYSIGNEIGERDGGSDGATWSKKLADKVRSLDNTRFVTSAVCGVFPDEIEGTNFEANLTEMNMLGNDFWGEKTEGYAAPLDIVGYNYLYRRYAGDGKTYPNRVIIGTETHSFNIYDYWQATLDNAHVVGDFIWTAVDNLGEAGVGKVYWAKDQEPFNFLAPYPWRANFQSDHDLCCFIQPQGAYRRVLWGVSPGPFLFTTHPKRHGDTFHGTGWHWHDVQERWGFAPEWTGKMVPVQAYADADDVEFVLNGRSMGRAKVEKLIASLDVPYETGTLEAVAYRGGAETGRCRLETTGAPAQVRLSVDRDRITADARDLSFVTVEILDRDGRRVPDAECAVRVALTGPGELAGLGSGDPKSEDQWGSGACTSYQGRALCVVKAQGVGEIGVKVFVDGVGEAGCTIIGI